MAIMKEKGTIYILGEIAQGETQNGNVWQRQQVVFEVPAGINVRRVMAQASTQMVADVQQFKVGDKVEFSYAVSARESKGKWYPNVELISIDAIETPQASVQQSAPQAPRQAARRAPRQAARRAAPVPQPQTAEQDSDDDLPF